MSDLYSEFLVKKESTAKDAIVKYGLIVLTVLAAGSGLFINPLLLVLAIALGVACYFVIPRTDLEYEYLFVNGEFDIDMVMAKSKRKKVMSVNLLLPDETDPVIWRGPIIAGTAKQFWTDVAWGDVDYMFVDMPPGTGDVPLTVFQSIPLDGIIVVTSPQELVSMIVGKAVKMAEMMNVPIIGLVENMSYAVCPDCGKHISVFGCSHIDETAQKFGLKVLAKLPINPELAVRVDNGSIEGFDCPEAESIADAIEGFRK